MRNHPIDKLRSDESFKGAIYELLLFARFIGNLFSLWVLENFAGRDEL